MQYKLGQELWSVHIDREDGKIVLSWELYIVRTIRKNRVYATAKHFATWGKRSKAHGDFGWLVPTDPLWTKQVDNVFSDLHTTKRKALVSLRKDIRGKYSWLEPEDKDPCVKKIDQALKRLSKKK